MTKTRSISLVLFASLFLLPVVAGSPDPAPDQSEWITHNSYRWNFRFTYAHKIWKLKTLKELDADRTCLTLTGKYITGTVSRPDGTKSAGDQMDNWIEDLGGSGKVTVSDRKGEKDDVSLSWAQGDIRGVARSLRVPGRAYFMQLRVGQKEWDKTWAKILPQVVATLKPIESNFTKRADFRRLHPWLSFPKGTEVRYKFEEKKLNADSVEWETTSKGTIVKRITAVTPNSVTVETVVTTGGKTTKSTVTETMGKYLHGDSLWKPMTKKTDEGGVWTVKVEVGGKVSEKRLSLGEGGVRRIRWNMGTGKEKVLSPYGTATTKGPGGKEYSCIWLRGGVAGLTAKQYDYDIEQRRLLPIPGQMLREREKTNFREKTTEFVSFKIGKYDPDTVSFKSTKYAYSVDHPAMFRVEEFEGPRMVARFHHQFFEKSAFVRLNVIETAMTARSFISPRYRGEVSGSEDDATLKGNSNTHYWMMRSVRAGRYVYFFYSQAPAADWNDKWGDEKTTGEELAALLKSLKVEATEERLPGLAPAWPKRPKEWMTGLKAGQSVTWNGITAKGGKSTYAVNVDKVDGTKVDTTMTQIWDGGKPTKIPVKADYAGWAGEPDVRSLRTVAIIGTENIEAGGRTWPCTVMFIEQGDNKGWRKMKVWYSTELPLPFSNGFVKMIIGEGDAQLTFTLSEYKGPE